MACRDNAHVTLQVAQEGGCVLLVKGQVGRIGELL
jgi:hypothetical protein